MGTSNDQVILEQLLNRKRQDLAPNMSADEFFELFVAEQILKSHDLSYDEIERGIVDGGGDGGIDSVYVLVNGKLVSTDNISEFSGLKNDVRIQLIIIQSKNSNSFSETAVDRLSASIRDLLDLSRELDELKSVYNADILEAFGVFRAVLSMLVPSFPQLDIQFFYASRAIEIHPNVKRKANQLEEFIKEQYSNSKPTFTFVSARTLLDLAHRQPVKTLQLQIAETPISTGQVGFICLVKLKDYYKFISDGSQLRTALFDANVRDYQGLNEVNREIRDTLLNPGAEDFWWLNNGITIVATSAALSGKTVTIEDPQIVNGLQTSFEIYNYFQTNPDAVDDRNVLVRVLVPLNDASRDRIIKATNNQTRIPPASLRATDQIHRDLEQLFYSNGLYYDRRKNSHKNAGIPIDKIISIPYLAQAVMAIVLREPDNSRGRPSSLLKNDDDYERVFNPRYPARLYLTCAQFMKAVDTFMKTDKASFASADRNNVRFHLAMFATIVWAKKYVEPSDFDSLDLSEAMAPEFLLACLNHVWAVFQQQQNEHGLTGDRVGKSPGFVTALLDRADQVLNGQLRLSPEVLSETAAADEDTAS